VRRARRYLGLALSGCAVLALLLGGEWFFDVPR
jgi:hypothetical protein